MKIFKQNLNHESDYHKNDRSNRWKIGNFNEKITNVHPILFTRMCSTLNEKIIQSLCNEFVI